MRINIFILMITSLLSCLQSTAVEENKFENETEEDSSKENHTYAAQLNKLFNRAVKEDSLDLHETFPFVYFKSGYFLNQNEKNCLSIEEVSSIYHLKLYRLKDMSWQVSDSLSLELSALQFAIHFKDYNFDGQTDIYLQVSASNGYVLSKGHLISIDPKTKKLKLHKETLDLANMVPNTQKQTVNSESLVYCKSSGKKEICIWTNKWSDGRLNTIEMNCPCKE